MCLCTGVLKPRTAVHVPSTLWSWASLTHTQWLARLIFSVWEHNSRSEPQVTAWFHLIFPKKSYFQQGRVTVNPSLLSFLDLSFCGWSSNSFKLSFFAFTSSVCSPKLIELSAWCLYNLSWNCKEKIWEDPFILECVRTGRCISHI